MGKRRVSQPEPSDPRSSLHGALVADERDLHQMTADEAEQQLRWFLERWCRQNPGAVVRVITGKGTRSSGAPVLKPLVRQLLDGPLAGLVEDYVVESGGGAYLIRLATGGKAVRR